MLSLIKEKVSVGFVIVITLIIAVAPNIAENWFEKKEKDRLFLLNQINAYGTLYYVYHTGTPKELVRHLKENCAYINEEDINIFYSIVEGAGAASFASLLGSGSVAVDMTEAPIVIRKDYDKKLANILLEKYKERLKIFKDKYL